MHVHQETKSTTAFNSDNQVNTESRDKVLEDTTPGQSLDSWVRLQTGSFNTRILVQHYKRRYTNSRAPVPLNGCGTSLLSVAAAHVYTLMARSTN